MSHFLEWAGGSQLLLITPILHDFQRTSFVLGLAILTQSKHDVLGPTATDVSIKNKKTSPRIHDPFCEASFFLRFLPQTMQNNYREHNYKQ